MLLFQLEQLCQQNISLDVNAAGPAGRTALHAAAEAGHAAAVRTLLGLGADSYCADDSGTSPLMLAAAGGHEAAVKVSPSSDMHMMRQLGRATYNCTLAVACSCTPCSWQFSQVLPFSRRHIQVQACHVCYVASTQMLCCCLCRCCWRQAQTLSMLTTVG